MKKSTCNPFPVILLWIVSALLIGILTGCDRSTISVTTSKPEPAATVTSAPAPITTEPAPIVALMPMNEAFSDEMKANVDAAYMETYNRSLEFEQTGDHEVWYLGTYDDGIVFYKKFVPPNGMHISYVDELVVADQVFSLSSYDTLCVYKDGTVKQVYDAYEDGEMSEEDVLLILEQYGKLMNGLLNWPDAVRPIE